MPIKEALLLALCIDLPKCSTNHSLLYSPLRDHDKPYDTVSVQIF